MLSLMERYTIIPGPSEHVPLITIFGSVYITESIAKIAPFVVLFNVIASPKVGVPIVNFGTTT